MTTAGAVEVVDTVVVNRGTTNEHAEVTTLPGYLHKTAGVLVAAARFASALVV
jgi:hypothetical protein